MVLERNRQRRKEGRNGTLVMSALHSILLGWLAQVNDFLVVFGGASFGAKAVLNRPRSERVSHTGLYNNVFPRSTGVPAPGPRTDFLIPDLDFEIGRHRRNYHSSHNTMIIIQWKVWWKF